MKDKIMLYSTSFERDFEIAKKLDIKGISIATVNITKKQVEEAHNAGLYVAVWNVISKEDNREAILKNPDYIQTDRVKYLVKLLKDL
jgi:glycerophosphoryl diester phosphodiesterase